MIPKIIHYCWFGRGEKSKLAQKCIDSWKKYCPDYEIIEWNEDNFNIEMNGYTRMCYNQKKYAFLSDYVRLLVVEQYGGIYFDVDVELIRPIDKLLETSSFFGFETDAYVNTGMGFGAEKGNPYVKILLEEYNLLLDGTNGTVGCPILNTNGLKRVGLKLDGQKQILEYGVVYPSDYFNPYDDPTGRLNKTSNTYSIHWYAKSWMSKKTQVRSWLTKPLHRLFGTEAFRKKR